MRATGDESGDVRGIDHEERAALVGDRAERLEVDDARVGGGAGDDQLGPFGQGDGAHFVVVDALGLAVDAVGDEVVEAAAGVDRRAVGEVPTLVEAQAHDLVAGLEQGEVGGHVGVGARVGLHVGVVGAEQLAEPRAGELLGLVDHQVAAVVALARVALGVLVGEHRALRGDDRPRREVLRRDELDGGVLPLGLALDDAGDRGVRRAQLVAAHLAAGSRHRISPFSSAVSSSTRRWWRPPSNSVASQTRRISSARPSPTTRAPIDSTLASLCRRENSAV